MIDFNYCYNHFEFIGRIISQVKIVDLSMYKNLKQKPVKFILEGVSHKGKAYIPVLIVTEPFTFMNKYHVGAVVSVDGIIQTSQLGANVRALFRATSIKLIKTPELNDKYNPYDEFKSLLMAIGIDDLMQFDLQQEFEELLKLEEEQKKK